MSQFFASGGPKYWSFSLSISPFNEYSGLISFKTDWLDLLAVQGTLKSLLQHLKRRGNKVYIPYIIQYTQPGLRPNLQFKKADIPVAKCLEIHVKGEHKKCEWILFSSGQVYCRFSFGANLKKKAFHWQELFGVSIARNVCPLVPEESNVLFSASDFK